MKVIMNQLEELKQKIPQEQRYSKHTSEWDETTWQKKYVEKEKAERDQQAQEIQEATRKVEEAEAAAAVAKEEAEVLFGLELEKERLRHEEACKKHEIEIQKKYEEDMRAAKIQQEKDEANEKLDKMRSVIKETELGKIIKHAVENWCGNWWKFQELSTTHADLKEKAEEMDKSYLKFPINSRGFQPKEIGGLETYWSKALTHARTMEITFPKECTIRQAMRIMYYTNLRLQYSLQMEAVSHKMTTIASTVSISGFRELMGTVRSKWEEETNAEFERMREKIGFVEAPIFPDNQVWQETIENEWSKGCQSTGCRKREEDAQEKKEALDKKARLINKEATLNDPNK